MQEIVFLGDTGEKRIVGWPYDRAL